MEQKNYHSSISANIAADEAFDAIADVTAWWAKDFKGNARQLGDTFSVQFGATTVDFEITEAIPGKKIIWKVTDCYLPWLNDKKEWNNTEILWEISSNGDNTQIDMTHIGLVPGVECYQACESGWNQHILGSLSKLIKDGVGEPK